jgi:hypothetical protein
MSDSVLDAIEALLARFVSFPHIAARTAVTLWVAHTHAFRFANATPYLNVYSPAPRCGKSTLFEVLELLVREPAVGSNMTPAVIYRLIAARQPTLLLDEIDAQLRNPDRAVDIQAVLNSGYRDGSPAWRCEGPNHTPTAFPTYCPKAYAGIGRDNLHQTTLDRSIPIPLERKLASEPLERFRRRHIQAEAEQVRADIAAWISDHATGLDGAEPELPEALNDRQQEIWEPLLAIADIAGADWPRRARSAAVQLHGDRDLEDVALGVQLLFDVRRAFDDAELQTLGSEELCSRLHSMRDSPWGAWRTHDVRTGITPRQLARRLRQFGIRPRTVRLGGETAKPTAKGYRHEQFEDAWARYLTDITEPSSDDE